MSKFDDIFKQKMGEDAHFDGRDKSWSQLDKRLDAFDAGQSLQPKTGLRVLRFWQIAAAASVAGLMWFGYQNTQISAKNAILEQKIAEISEINLQKLVGENAQSDSKTADFSIKKEAVSESLTEKNTQKTAEKITKNNEKQIDFLTKKEAVSENLNEKNTQKTAEKITKNDPKTADFLVKKDVISENLTEKNTQKIVEKVVKNDSTSLIENNQNNQVLNEKSTFYAEIEQKNAEIAALLVKIELQKTAYSTANVAPIPTKMASVLTSETVALPIVFSAKTVARVVRKPARVCVGISAFATNNLSKKSGQSRMTGQGISIDYPIKNGFSVSAQADWGRFSFATKKLPRHISEPDSVDYHHQHNMNHHFEFKKASGVQAQQTYSLGLKYAVPTHFWLQPVVRVGHSWVRSSAIEVTFEYEEKPDNGGPGPGPNNKPPELISRKIDPILRSNIWRAGLGLDAHRGAWTVGISGEFNRDFSKNEAADLLTFRGGLAYNF